MAGQLQLRRHRVRFAEEYLRKAVALDPRLAQAHRELIYILGYQLRRAELNAEFLALSEISDLTYDMRSTGACCVIGLWEPGTAVEDLTQFIQADPEDRWSRLAIAENYRRMGRLDDAEAAIAPLPPFGPGRPGHPGPAGARPASGRSGRGDAQGQPAGLPPSGPDSAAAWHWRIAIWRPRPATSGSRRSTESPNRDAVLGLATP